jgi:hypothetical protein
MARLRLLEPYNGHEAGTVIEMPGGVASTLILNRLAVLDTEPPAQVAETEKPKPRAKGK